MVARLQATAFDKILSVAGCGRLVPYALPVTPLAIASTRFLIKAACKHVQENFGAARRVFAAQLQAAVSS